MDPLMEDDLGALFFGSNPLFDDPTPAPENPTNPTPDNPKPVRRRKEPEKGKRKRRMSSDLAIIMASEVIESPNTEPAGEQPVTESLEKPLPQNRRSSRIRRKSIEFGRKQYLPTPMLETLDTSENLEAESVTESSEKEHDNLTDLASETTEDARNTENSNNNNAYAIDSKSPSPSKATETPTKKNIIRFVSDDEEPDENIKLLYLNKNFKWPTPKSWTTIFEQPQVSKTGQDSLTFGKRQVNRSINFDTMTVGKLKKRQRKGSQNGWKKRRVSIARDREMQERIDRLDDIILGNVVTKSQNTTPVMESASKAPASKKARTARRVQRAAKKELPSVSEEATSNENAVISDTKETSTVNPNILSIPQDRDRTPTPPLLSESDITPPSHAIADIVKEQPRILESVPDTVSKRRGRGRKPKSKTTTSDNQNQSQEPKTGANGMNIVEIDKGTIESENGENNIDGRAPKDVVIDGGDNQTNSAVHKATSGSPGPPRKKRKRGKRSGKKKQKVFGEDFSEDLVQSSESKDSVVSNVAKANSDSSEMIAAEQAETECIPLQTEMKKEVSDTVRTVEIEGLKSSADRTRRSTDDEITTSVSEKSVSRSSLEMRDSVSRSSTEKSELSIKLFENDPSLNYSNVTDSWSLRSKTPNESKSAPISEMVTDEKIVAEECSRNDSQISKVSAGEFSADSSRDNENRISKTRDSTERSLLSEFSGRSEMTDSTDFQRSDFEASESHDISSRTMSPAFDAPVQRQSTNSFDDSSAVEKSDLETVNEASRSDVEDQNENLERNEMKSFESASCATCETGDASSQTPSRSALQGSNSNSSLESVPSTNCGSKADVLKTPSATPLVTQADPFTTPLTTNRQRPESPEIAASYLNKFALFSALFSKS